MARIWIMTGASRGFGRSFTEAAAAAGDTVVATARNPDALKPLVEAHGDKVVPMKLDVTDRAACFAVAEETVRRFGKIDILCNNAGYGLRGAVEELDEAQIRAQMEPNFFGAVWMTQAVIPQMRGQKSGHIIQISSLGGHLAYPALSVYHASKWALEGFSESLQGEVAPFGIKVTIVEPSGFRTDWGGDSMIHADLNPAYDFLPGRQAGALRAASTGDPDKAAAALMQVVDMAEPPLRILMGPNTFGRMLELYNRRLGEWYRWNKLTRETE